MGDWVRIYIGKPCDDSDVVDVHDYSSIAVGADGSLCVHRTYFDEKPPFVQETVFAAGEWKSYRTFME